MTKKEERDIIFTLSGACLAAFFLIRHNRGLLVLALFLIVSGIIGGRLPSAVARGWKRFALGLGDINSRVILFVAFYLFLTPLAVLFRAFNKKEVGHFKRNDRASLLEDVNRRCGKDLFEKMW